MDNMVKKYNAFEILVHWVMAISCIVLAIQGYAFLFHIEAIGSFFGGFESMRAIHNYIGIAFTVTLFISLFLFLKESLTYDADDIGWIKVLGGYLSHKVKVPPMGKVNTGQKFFYLGLVVFGAVIVLSGFVLWLMSENKQWVMYGHLLHNISFIVLMIAVPAHMYLGSLANPGTLRLMISGTAPYWWVKKVSPKWIQELEGHK
ncbi:MAG: formate dehydrogenase subunit gamma [bacterium]